MIYLHIGTLKTGSKSLQAFLGDHREPLRERGWSVYQGCIKGGTNHTELHLATLRDDRDSLGRLKWPQARGEAYRQQIVRRVQDFLRSRDTPHAVLSNEGLSLLRHPDELDRLAQILAGDDLRLILYLREPQAFLRAYERQIGRVPGRAPSADPASALYVRADSWLVDYRALVDAYTTRFGRAALTVVDYDRELATRGSILHRFQEFLGVPPDARLPVDGYFLNRSTDPRRGDPTNGDR